MAFNKAKALQDAEKSVSQGKTSQAIKQYLQVLEKEPADLGLLNTVGDLYVRDRNMAEALKYFHKLAESYTQEGFTVKAVAIYKKISKLEPTGVDVLMKMADLYMVQGLSREAREQFTQAVEFYKKKNQNDKALEVFHKIVAVDPENIVYRVRLAEFCESLGKKEEATRVYLDTVEIAFRRGDTPGAESSLKKALNLDAKNPRLHLFQARLALAKNQPDEVEKIFDSTPELKSDPAARQILLEAYLSGHKIQAAEKLVVDAFHSNPNDFSSMTAFVELCMGNDEFDAAYQALADVADIMINYANVGPLMDLLRRIWTKRPDHIPNLELIYRIAEKTADEFTLPEVLEALGQAYAKAGELEKAEKVYRQLVNREPENEQLKELLKQVLQKQGKEPSATTAQDLSNVEMALPSESEDGAAKPQVTGAEAEEAAIVNEALGNCDLFSRYGLLDKAFAELDKVLALYPNQVEIYKRMLEISQKGEPARATEAAKSLARIYAERSDSANARRYELLASKTIAPVSSEPMPPPVTPAAPEESPSTVATEFDLSSEFLDATLTETPAPTPTSEETSADLLAPSIADPPSDPPTREFDLSGGWEASSSQEAAPPAEPVAPSGFNFEDSKVEVDYYLDQGFFDEARSAVITLEENFPGDPQVAELRRRVERRTTPQPRAIDEEKPQPVPPATKGEAELPASFAESASAETPTETPSPIEEPPPPREEEIPPVEEPPPPPEETSPPVEEPPPATSPRETVSVEDSFGAPGAPASSGDPMGGLIDDLEASLDGIGKVMPSAPVRAHAQERAPVASHSPSGPASPLSGFLDEFSEGDQREADRDDPQTHYDLGVAFREMNLLDEAIGEFQKVVKGAHKGVFPPHFLQACTLLALCFMDKKLPAIAIKWYLRALELPDLDEEATMAVQYDLGVAYEQAGDMRTALEKFSEVYSQNIDYRDVAEKIRLLQTKS